MAKGAFRRLMHEVLEARELKAGDVVCLDGHVMGEMFDQRYRSDAEVSEDLDRMENCRRKLVEVLGEKYAELGLLLAQGYSYREIAAMKDVSHMTVKRWVDNAGIVDELMRDYSPEDFLDVLPG